MQDELWRQWQGFAALWNPVTPGAHSSSAGEGNFGFKPFVDAAERFKTAAQSFLATAASGSPPAAAEAAQKFGDFLRDQFADARLPWNAPMGAGAGNSAQQPSWSDWPALGPMREHQQRWQRMAEAGRRVDEAQRRLQRLWSDALRQAAVDFAARLRAPLPGLADPEPMRKLYDSWIDCAEDAYARIAHGEAFCTAQAELVNAGSEWRQELRGGIEHWAKLLDLPTRSEINTLVQRLRSVEQQLRATVSGVRAGARKASPAASPARPRPPAAARKHARRKAKR